jgi:hypothetical protein
VTTAKLGCPRQERKRGPESAREHLAADYTPSVNELILTAYDQFIRDERTRKVFAASAEDLKSAPPAAASPAAPECILNPPRSTVPVKLMQCESIQDCKDGGICFDGVCRH